MKEYNRSNVKISRVLRKNMTKHERKLWYLFLREYPVKFQRQKAIDEYIADFYCAKAKLIIELDGSGHYTPTQILKDRIRTERLEEMDLTVIRICNLDIDNNFRNVCEYIDTLVKTSLPQSLSATAPSSEGAESRC
jgi:very-short-patch-repair endonuclease